VIDRAKEVGQVHINDDRHLVVVEMLIERLDRVVATPARTKPVGAVQKPGLVHALQHLLHHLLHQLVLQDADAQGPHGPRLPVLGDQHLPHRQGPVRHPFHPFHQVVQVLRQMLAILRFRNPINAHGLRPVQLVKARRQRFHVEVVHQAVETLARIARGKPRYPLQFRVRV
jgi:hypothetical protein